MCLVGMNYRETTVLFSSKSPKGKGQQHQRICNISETTNFRWAFHSVVDFKRVFNKVEEPHEASS